MSRYQFGPAYAYNLSGHPYVQWRQALSPQECRQVIEAGEAKQLQDAKVRISDMDEDYRRSKVSWLTEEDVPWLYERLEWIVQQLNGQFYQYDLWGFDEDMQYTVYESEDEGFYDWHVDHFQSIENNIDLRRQRKMSLTIQLNDATQYVGGDILFNTGRVERGPKGLGTAIMFPSHTLHKVNPVTEGIRRSLVVWICGPHFR